LIQINGRWRGQPEQPAKPVSRCNDPAVMNNDNEPPPGLEDGHGAANVTVQRILELARHPPDGYWDGVSVSHEK
jgi:hypothetical protein